MTLHDLLGGPTVTAYATAEVSQASCQPIGLGLLVGTDVATVAVF